MKKTIAAMLIVVGVLAPTAAMAAPYASNTDGGGSGSGKYKTPATSSMINGGRGATFASEHLVMSGGYYRFEPFW